MKWTGLDNWLGTIPLNLSGLELRKHLLAVLRQNNNNAASGWMDTK